MSSVYSNHLPAMCKEVMMKGRWRCDTSVVLIIRMLHGVCLQMSWSSLGVFLFLCYGILNGVELFEKSMETFLCALLKTARGVEVVESVGLLGYCARRLLCPSSLVSGFDELSQVGVWYSCIVSL